MDASVNVLVMLMHLSTYQLYSSCYDAATDNVAGVRKPPVVGCVASESTYEAYHPGTCSSANPTAR